MEINWKYYFGHSLWTERIAACLLFECDPNKFKLEHELNDNPFILKAKDKRIDQSVMMSPLDKIELIEKIDDVIDKIKTDIFLGHLVADNFKNGIDNYPLNNPINSRENTKEFLVKPSDFINWAINKNQLKVPQPMKSFLSKTQQEKSKPSLTDLRKLHVVEWVEKNNYTGGSSDKVIYNKLCDEKSDLWGTTIDTFQKWMRTQDKNEIKKLLPNIRRK